MAFEHGDPDYVRLIDEGPPGEREGIVFDRHPEPAALMTMFGRFSVDTVINAAEPYAEGVSATVATACDVAGLPLLRAVPPSFGDVAGSSRWTWVASFEAAGFEATRHPGNVLIAMDPLHHAGRLGDLGTQTAISHRRRMSVESRLPSWAREPESTRPLWRPSDHHPAAGAVERPAAAQQAGRPSLSLRTPCRR
ncbi:precorrin-6A/cobalt-precorrin-6A reductase [Jiangella gansuensis]|uniref:precorrin-6A/cobalt-precorrin-6A reductase n=1 Tax=Jiangella gansuensis TaxID=281473 RepID=UPI0004786FE5|nr:precorrin-6A/cobalt-precorrin-6A reductase [Jiangella gansuensis]